MRAGKLARPASSTMYKYKAGTSKYVLGERLRANVFSLGVTESPSRLPDAAFAGPQRPRTAQKGTGATAS